MKEFLARVQSFVGRTCRREISYLTHKPRKIFFDHLPKCGGTTLNHYLVSHFPQRKIFFVDSESSIKLFQESPESFRFNFDFIFGHNASEIIDFVNPDCFKVTMFRNPIDRVYSYFHYVKKTQEHPLHASFLESEISLKQYALSEKNPEICNWYTTHFSGYSLDDAKKEPDKAVSAALVFIQQRYDLIGFLSDFEAFVENLRYNANLKHSYDGKKRNVTHSALNKPGITAEEVMAIKVSNQMDISLYQKLKESVRT